jgi:hypothetical protein
MACRQPDCADTKEALIHYSIVEAEPVVSLPEFYALRELLVSTNHHLQPAKISNKAFYDLSLWLSDADNNPWTEALSDKLFFLTPADQLFALRKLFQLKANGIRALAVSDLEMMRFIDLSLYKTGEEVAPDLHLDLSVAIVIEVLNALSKGSGPLLFGDLIGVMLKNITSDRKRKFQITELFEGCEGRMEMKYDWHTNNREITKVFFNDTYYWAVSTPAHDSIANEVSAITGTRWNSGAGHWGVPRAQEDVVLLIAQENRFFINVAGSHYDNNMHLAALRRTNVPRGVSYCEGRIANGAHKKYGVPFWFCSGSLCFQNCETAHSPEAWEHYTLLDFCQILGLGLDGEDAAGDMVTKGQYYKFIATINRFNQLIDHLYCRDCEEILSPTVESVWGVSRVSRFSCTNNSCKSYRITVYLNHCLNGKCNSVIDSRDSKKCTHGLYICSNESCGTCCSHKMFSTRLGYLEKVKAHVPPNLSETVHLSVSTLPYS